MKILILFLFITFSHQDRYEFCYDCVTIQNNLISIFEDKKHFFYKVIDLLCNLKSSVDFCNYFTYKFGDLAFVYKKQFLQETNYLCSNVLQFCPLKFKPFDYEDFKNQIQQKYPKNQTKFPAVKTEPFKVLVITDVHIQPNYAYKSKISCNERENCCYEGRTPDGPQDEAGYYGSYGCDIPKRTFELSLQDMKQKEFDLIFTLGDIYSHKYYKDKTAQPIWDTNKYFYDKIAENFKDKIVIPSPGNHDHDPVDFFDFDDPENSAIKNIINLYEPFIGRDKILALIKDGFYEIELTQYNLKVISLNSQLGDIFNLYNVNHNTNTLEFVNKLADSLYKSEKINQKVIIISHIPVKSRTIEGYTIVLEILIERFKDTIANIISGHTHNDGIQFFKDKMNQIYHYQFIVSSLTTLNNHNPSYRIFEFNEYTQFKDYKHYRLNLDYYNKLYEEKRKEFKFDLAYKFKQEYSIKQWQTSQDYHDFLMRFIYDEIIQQKYISNKKNQYHKSNWRDDYMSTSCQLQTNTPSEQALCTGANKFGFLQWIVEHPWLEKA